MGENTMACITAFNPGPDFENICSFISKQVEELLIVDNSTDGSLADSGKNFPANAVIICNHNKGAVSGALNIALLYARNKGYEFLHIFDQDTVPPTDITAALMKAFETTPDAAVISPRFLNSSTNHPGRVLSGISRWRVKSIWPGEDVGMVKVLFTISSASLIAIKKLPPDTCYDTRLIVDGCDIDFCLHLSGAGLSTYVNTAVCVQHGLGARKKGGGRWSATNYSPLRKQLSAKNRMMIWRRYGVTYPGYVLNDGYVFLLDSARTLLLEKDRFTKMIALCRGIWHGLREKNINERHCS